MRDVPSRSNCLIQPYSALQSASDFSSTISNTGVRSNALSLMAASSSLVAVCRSRASFVSLNSRTFSMAMTAWRANVSTSRISLSLNGRTWPRFIAKLPITRSSRIIGTTSAVR